MRFYFTKNNNIHLFKSVEYIIEIIIYLNSLKIKKYEFANKLTIFKLIA
jgi:hypothetical protein